MMQHYQIRDYVMDEFGIHIDPLEIGRWEGHYGTYIGYKGPSKINIFQMVKDIRSMREEVSNAEEY